MIELRRGGRRHHCSPPRTSAAPTSQRRRLRPRLGQPPPRGRRRRARRPHLRRRCRRSRSTGPTTPATGAGSPPPRSTSTRRPWRAGSAWRPSDLPLVLPNLGRFRPTIWASWDRDTSGPACGRPCQGAERRRRAASKRVTEPPAASGTGTRSFCRGARPRRLLDVLGAGRQSRSSRAATSPGRGA